MDAGLLLGAVGLFAVTNLDDIVLLTLYFGRANRAGGAGRQIVIGQYLGFGLIIIVSLLGSLGVGLLPESAIAYLGLLPIAIGVRAAITAWREGRAVDTDETKASTAPLTARSVATVTVASGGDDIGIYIPVFATIGVPATIAYCAIFLALVAVWCVAGRYLAERRPIALALERWGHVLLPAILVSLGIIILVQGGAFGL